MAINQNPVLIFGQDLGYNIVANILQGNNLNIIVKNLPPTTGDPYSYDWFMRADVPYVEGIKYWASGGVIQTFSSILYTNTQDELKFSVPVPIGIESLTPGKVFSFTFQVRKGSNVLIGVEVVFYVENISSNPDSDGLIIAPDQIYEKLINKAPGLSNPNDTTYPTTKLLQDQINPLKTTSGITEGANLYFLPSRVLVAALTGLSTATNAVITSADTILGALGKLQAQINPLKTTSGITEGANLYFTSNRVLSTVLAGIDVVTSGLVTAADTVVQAIGKLQALIRTNIYYTIAASDAPARWKNRADVVCDGIADDAEINAARDLMYLNDAGGTILFSPGTFNLANPIKAYRFSALQTPTLHWKGAGQHNTYIKPASGVHGFTVARSSHGKITDFCLLLSGSSMGIADDAAAHQIQDLPWRMKDFEIKDIYISGATGHTGHAMSIQSFRTTIHNIACGSAGISGYGNVGNGVKLFCSVSPNATDPGFNAGDSVMKRCHITISGTVPQSAAVKIVSPQASETDPGVTSDRSYFNQMTFEQIVTRDNSNGANDTKAFQIGEPGGYQVKGLHFLGVNAEEFSQGFDLYNAQGVFAETYFMRMNGTNPIYWRSDAQSKNNHWRSATICGVYEKSPDVINDYNSDPLNPNTYSNLNIDTIFEGEARINGSLTDPLPAGVQVNAISSAAQNVGTKHIAFRANQGLGGVRTFTGGQVNVGGRGGLSTNTLYVNRLTGGADSSTIRFSETLTPNELVAPENTNWEIGVKGGYSNDLIFRSPVFNKTFLRLTQAGGMALGDNWDSEQPTYALDVKGSINATGTIRIGGIPLNTSMITENVANLYFTVGRVLSAALTGLSTATSTAITSSDTVLQAFGKLQAQINTGAVALASLTTSAVTEGTNLYFTTARVLSTALTGLSTATNAVITSADTVLVALGKLQGQISAISSTAWTWTANHVYSSTSSVTFGKSTIYTPRGITPIEGEMFLSSNQIALEAMLSGLRQFLSTSIYSLTNSTAVTNTTTETDTLGIGVGTRTIAANSAVIGKVYKIAIGGHYTTGATPIDFNYRLKLGSLTLNAANLISGLPANQTNSQYRIRATTTYRGIGASGNITVNGDISFYNAATKTYAHYPIQSTSSLTIDTTANNQIQATVQYASASTNDSIIARQAVININQ